MPVAPALLWRFSGRGISGYLFGSIHLKLKNSESFLSEIGRYISVCDSLLTEIRLDDSAMDPSMILLPNDASYKSLIHERGYKRIIALFEERMGLDIETQSRWKPLLLLNFLSAKISGYDLNEPSLDQQIYDQALKHGIANEGLEDLRTHFSHLDMIPLRIQMQFLNKACKNLKSVKLKFNRLLEAYLEQDINYIYRASKRQLGEWRKPFINERNHAMTQKLLAMEKGKRYFVCIGAGHLAGNQGMLALLKRASFKLEPVLIKQ